MASLPYPPTDCHSYIKINMTTYLCSYGGNRNDNVVDNVILRLPLFFALIFALVIQTASQWQA